MSTSEGKMVHHRCGCALWSVVADQFGEHLVVHYRIGGPDGLLVFMCPQCRRSLKMWWDAPQGWVSRAWRPSPDL